MASYDVASNIWQALPAGVGMPPPMNMLSPPPPGMMPPGPAGPPMNMPSPAAPGMHMVPGMSGMMGGGGGGPGGAAPCKSTMMNVNGTMRRLQPVCAQALPWSTSFIGCPGIRCAADEDFTLLFKVGTARHRQEHVYTG